MKVGGKKRGKEKIIEKEEEKIIVKEIEDYF